MRILLLQFLMTISNILISYPQKKRYYWLIN